MKRFSVFAIVSLSLLLMLFTLTTDAGADVDESDYDVRNSLSRQGVWLTLEEALQQKAGLHGCPVPLDDSSRLVLMLQINGSPVKALPYMDVVENQVMVPIRWAAEQLGAAAVEWDGDTRTITITSPQDFYSLEKLDSYNRGLKVGTDELENRLWPLPDKVKDLSLSDLMPDRPWTLELADYKDRFDLNRPPTPVYIRITDPDGLYEHGSLLYSADNRQGHYYVPMDWLGYLFNARVNYDPITNMLSVDTPDMEKVKSEIARIEYALIPSDPDEAIKLWGRGEQTRNGALQYLALSPELRQDADQSDYVRQSYWVTGGSSPWVGPITIVSREELGPAGRLYTLSFPEMTSSPPHTTATEKLLVGKCVSADKEGWFITGLLKSSGYGIIDGPGDYVSNDVDGDGKPVTAQITVDNNKNRYLTVYRDESETAIEVFTGDKKGFGVSTTAIDHQFPCFTTRTSEQPTTPENREVLPDHGPCPPQPGHTGRFAA